MIYGKSMVFRLQQYVGFLKDRTDLGSEAILPWLELRGLLSRLPNPPKHTS
jgi:hypothetical protein